MTNCARNYASAFRQWIRRLRALTDEYNTQYTQAFFIGIDLGLKVASAALFGTAPVLFILSLLIYSLALHSFILRLNPLMAVKEVAFVFACWLYLASATFCINNDDCGFLEKCCKDSVCRQKCDYCSFNYQCGTGECCWSGDCQKKCSDGKCRKNCDSCSYSSQCDSDECCDSDDTCKLVCTHSLTSAAVAGIVISCLAVAAIVISIVAFCCCACCPYYRTRHPGTVVVTQPMGGFIATTQPTQQTIQQPPYGGYNPPPPGYMPPPSGYNPPPIPSTKILAGVFVYLPPFISQILDFIHWMVLIFVLIYFEWRDTENQQLCHSWTSQPAPFYISSLL